MRTMNFERRYWRGVAKVASRAEGDAAAGRVISGYAATFFDPTKPETQIELYDGVFERIMPTAFDRVFAEKQDVRCLFNHADDNVLGRVSSGSLRLAVDSVGLRYSCDENQDDPLAAGVCARIARGDVSGSSFTFIPTKTVWVDDLENDVSIREIHDCNVLDVGPVTFPWYSGTSAAIGRAVGSAALPPAIAEECAARRAQKRAAGENLDAARRRVEIEYRLAVLRMAGQC